MEAERVRHGPSPSARNSVTGKIAQGVRDDRDPEREPKN